MTTLYRPVLIETAEQAEALPIGTVATRGAIAAVRVPEQTHDEPWRSGVLGWEHVSAIGWTALVPIEAEEDFQKAGGASVYDGGMGAWPDRTRLVTPWEAV